MSKLHLASDSTSGTRATEDPTVRSLLAAKSACAHACGVSAWVILFMADISLITVSPPTT